jgi:hypothetical protein
MFTLGITLGNGVTGQIRKCENKERSNLKCVKMINTGEQGTKQYNFYDEGLNEIQIVSKLYHPMII